MLKRSCAAVFAAALAVAVPGLAYADTCFSIGTGDYVAKGFAKPGRGKCRALYGFSSQLPSLLISGVACTSSDGDTLKVQWTGTNGPGGPVFAETIRGDLPLPSMTGGTAAIIVVSASGNSVGSTSASAAKCDPKNVPIP